MNLNTERKIKFWLSTIAKILVIALVAFKLIPFVLDTNELPEDNIIADKNEALKIEGDSAVPLENTNITKLDSILKETVILKKQVGKGIAVNDSTSSSSKNDYEVIEKSIGIFIFDENNLDRAIARQLEKTVLDEYNVKSIAATPNKKQLLNGIMKGFSNLENACIGTVSYTFKENAGKISCALRLDFDTYIIQTRFKIKDRSGSIMRYGIGFSKEQAKAVAIAKVNTL